MTTVDTQTIQRHHDTAPQQPVDDGRRYMLVGPCGVSPFLDALRPGADHPAITVYGSADLARRVAEAHRLGVCVAWRQLDEAAAAVAAQYVTSGRLADAASLLDELADDLATRRRIVDRLADDANTGGDG